MWRVAKSLDKLLAQINAMAPNRNKASDGSICDELHERTSDHCPHDFPELGSEVVTARDFTHDPLHGANMHEISETLRLSRDPRIKYVIWNRRIFSINTNYRWETYTGTNPHDKHMHVSVVPKLIADSTAEWEVSMAITDDEIRRIAEAAAAKVLGRAWTVSGRTLAGSVEAMLANDAARYESLLSAINADDNIPVTIAPDQIPVLAAILAEMTPKAGTFTLTPTTS